MVVGYRSRRLGALITSKTTTRERPNP
jgi:hypothetical protein